MKRNLHLIRDIIIEAATGKAVQLPADKGSLAYHYTLVVDAGFVVRPGGGLTWKGWEVYEKIKDDNVWAQADRAVHSKLSSAPFSLWLMLCDRIISKSLILLFCLACFGCSTNPETVNVQPKSGPDCASILKSGPKFEGDPLYETWRRCVEEEQNRFVEANTQMNRGAMRVMRRGSLRLMEDRPIVRQGDGYVCYPCEDWDGTGSMQCCNFCERENGITWWYTFNPPMVEVLETPEDSALWFCNGPYCDGLPEDAEFFLGPVETSRPPYGDVFANDMDEDGDIDLYDYALWERKPKPVRRERSTECY